MKKAFITGAAGFLASHLTERLIKKGYRITCLVKDHHNTKNIEHKNVKIIRGSLLKPETFSKYIQKNSEVFHCYSLSPGANADRETYFIENVEGTKNLLNNCKNIKKLIYISTASVIGPKAEKNQIMDEETEPTPDNYYGQSKLAAEKIINEFYNKTKIQTTIIRISTLYGPRCHKNSASLRLFKLMKNPVFIVIGNGKNIYEFNYIKNVADGVILASEKSKKFKIYNIGDIKKRNYIEVINEIAKNINKKVIVVHIPKVIAYAAGYIGDITSKITKKQTIFTSRTVRGLMGGWATSYKKAEKEIKLKQKYKLEKGIEETSDWIKENKII